jgi:hypothetical protein
VPGGRIDSLEGVAKHAEIKDLRQSLSSNNKRLMARIVLLRPDGSATVPPYYEHSTTQLVKTIIDTGDASIGQIREKFPGPYRIDFQNLGGNPVLIFQKGGSNRAYRAFRPKMGTENRRRPEHDVWSFLYDLCVTAKEADPRVKHAMVQIWSEGRPAATVVEGIQQTLQKHRDYPIVWKHLFVTEKGHGWVLDPDTYVIGLPHSKWDISLQGMVDWEGRNGALDDARALASEDISALLSRVILTQDESKVLKGWLQERTESELAEEMHCSESKIKDIQNTAFEKLRNAKKEDEQLPGSRS